MGSPKHKLSAIFLHRFSQRFFALSRVLTVLALVVSILAVYSYTRASLSERAYAAPGITKQINFQGKLVNPNGTNVTDGTYTIVFSIYTVASGGTAVWTESQTPTLSNGIFQVNLGSVTALPGSVDFNTDNIYLGIKVGADAEMTPRVQFTSVPQAFNAERLGGLTSSGFIQNTTTQQAATNFNIAGTGVVGTSLTTPVLQSGAGVGLTITGNAASTWSTTAGNLALQAGGTGNITFTPSSATAVVNVLTGNLKVGDAAPTVALNGEDAYIEGTLEVDGTSRFDAAVTISTGGLTVSAGGASITGTTSISGNTTIATTAGNTLSLGNSTGTLTVTGNSTSSFVINGVTVTATQFNLLSGKDTALVDTTDAVNTAITGTGALGAGSITTGFGAINVGADNITSTATVTGATVNATTGINTGAGAGTQRIDASGNLTNIGTYSGSGNITTTGGVLTVQGTGTSSFTGSLQIQGSILQRSNLFPDFTRSFGGGTDLNWKKAADVVIAGGNIFAAASFQVDIIDANSNYGATSDVIPMRFYVSAVRSTGTQDVPDSGSVAGPSTDYVRLVKTSLGIYEIQVRQPANFRDLDVSIRELSENGSTTVTYNGALSDGSTTGTIYTPSTTGYTQDFANIDVNGNLLTANTTRLTAAGVLQNVTNADAGTFFTGGTLGVARGGTGLASYTVGDLLYANGAASLGRLTAVASGSCLISQGVGVAPVWGSCATGGGITGSGTSGQVTYFNGTGTVTSSNNLLFNGTTLTVNTLSVTGAITTGTWNGSVIAANYGGTGQTVYTIGDLLYASGTTALSKLAASTVGQCLKTNGVGTAPTWGNCINSVGATNQIAYYSSAGTLAGSNNLTYDGTTLSVSGEVVLTAAALLRTTAGTEFTLQAGTNGGAPIRLFASQIYANNDGTASNPAWSFSGSTATGIFIDTGNYLSFSKGGVKTFCSSSSQVYVGGSLGDCGVSGAASLRAAASSNAAAQFDRKNTAGAVVQFAYNGTNGGNVSITTGGVVSYNAFTGSHYAKIESGQLDRGELASLTGNNEYISNIEEPRYGVLRSKIANDPNILGSYLGQLEEGKPYNVSTNPYLIMAAGNGDVWIADNGTGNVAIGDPLISSGDVAGYAQRDPKTYKISHVFAKAAEPINWNAVSTTIDGIKVKKISVLYSFYDAENIDTRLQSQDLSVAGDTVLEGDVSINANLNVSGATILSSLTVKGDVLVEGNLTVLGDIETETITVNGHIITGGEAPVAVAEAALGTSLPGSLEQPQVMVDGNDSAGTLTFTTGQSGLVTGALGTVTFNTSFDNGFKTQLTALNEAATDLRVYIVKTGTGFTIMTRDVPEPNKTYEFDYMVVGAK